MNQKRFINITIITLVIVIAGTIGYFALVKKKTLQSVDNCNLISNSSFRSINQYEIGEGPNGPVPKGYWEIDFQGNKFEWNYSDVAESGTYTCKDSVLQAKFSSYTRTITARYDGSKKILTWDGIEYKKVE